MFGLLKYYDYLIYERSNRWRVEMRSLFEILNDKSDKYPDRSC